MRYCSGVNPLHLELFLTDGIGPFFRANRRAEINWSKIDFADLDADGPVSDDRCRQIADDFRTFTRRAASIGYNAVTLDDLAHLVLHPLYPEPLRQKIIQYRKLYRILLNLAAEAGMTVFITTDLLFFNSTIEQITGNRPQNIRAFAAACCRNLFESFPETGGIISRIGESDGVDVSGDFQSRLVLKTPADARRILKALLPVFEQHGKLLIFRTWTVGISRLGDLIWNPKTFHRIFDGIHSPQLIISMKHGESDFFRYLPVNRLFFETDHRKLIELQARREYEGFGEFPSFIGHDCEKIFDQLISARNIAGISVWCQTGGWSGFRRLTLIDHSGIWNEINAFAALRIFRDNLSSAQILQIFCKEQPETLNWTVLRELLETSERVIKELLYIEEFATHSIFFRRLRLPPLITVYWKHILISHFIRKIFRCYVSPGSGRELVREGYRALRDIRRMQVLTRQLGLPEKDFEFQYDTFRLISVARAYYFLEHPERTLRLLQKMKTRYEAKWPEPRYAVHIDTKPFPLRRIHLSRIIRILLRKQSGYRKLDRVLAVVLYGFLQPLIRRANRRIFPDFAQKQAMGIDSVFK
jgi:hypothetical protein